MVIRVDRQGIRHADEEQACSQVLASAQGGAPGHAQGVEEGMLKQGSKEFPDIFGPKLLCDVSVNPAKKTVSSIFLPISDNVVICKNCLQFPFLQTK